MKLKLLKRIVWIKFLQFEKQKTKKVEFVTFFKVYTVCVLFSGIFPGLWINLLVLLSHIPYIKSEELPPACLFEVSLGYGH